MAERNGQVLVEKKATVRLWMIRCWDVTVFTKNRQRLLACDSADAFFAAVLKQARSRDLQSDEHFTVDGTLLEAWAGPKSFRRLDDNYQTPINGTGEGSKSTVNFPVRTATIRPTARPPTLMQCCPEKAPQ